MTLRARLIASIVLVLLSSVACGGVVMGWHAARSVRTELQVALDVGARSIRNGMDEIAAAQDQPAALRHLVASFDGNRHVQAELLDASGQVVSVSSLYRPDRPAPAWFRHIIGTDLPTQRIGAILLRANSRNEVSEAWGASVDALAVLGGFSLAVTLLICGLVRHALRPLEQIAAAFARVGNGDYSDRIDTGGPAEVRHLARGFNLMSEQLTAMAAQNRRLNERLLTLQAEERAELARDLHDEVGPLLFAIDMTAATIDRLATGGRAPEIPAQARSIHDAVARAQAHVRSLLGRLRPIHAAGLKTSIERLAAFWRRHRPDIAITVQMPEDSDQIGDDLKETVYRVVQEGLSNAVRHGKPRRVEVVVSQDGLHDLRVEVRDDGAGLPLPTGGRPLGQLGLVGIRERVMALTGAVSIAPGLDGRGTTLIVRLPLNDRVVAA
jgi:two-component system, NarL family, sensor histidine kinase UhpB